MKFHAFNNEVRVFIFHHLFAKKIFHTLNFLSSFSPLVCCVFLGNGEQKIKSFFRFFAKQKEENLSFFEDVKEKLSL